MKRSAPNMSRKKNAKPAAALIAICVFLALSLWLGDELWDLAVYWPASGTGFGATVGVLLPITFTAAERSFRRAGSVGNTPSPRWVVAGTVCATAALVSGMAAARAVPGKGSSASCHSEWQPCWVGHLYPGAFLVTLGSLATTIAVLHWLPRRLSKVRPRPRR
ncbi:hypothetical protein STENM223S_03938 [Streptomyces tendae]